MNENLKDAHVMNLTAPNPFTSKKTLSKIIPAAIATKYERQELYLNKADQYFKNVAERKKRIDYMVNECYNGSIMYGIDGVLKPNNFNAVRDFIGEQKARGVKRVGLAYSSKSGIDDMVKFNASSVHTSIQTKIDNTVSEFEPWVSTSGVTWPQFFALLEYAQAKMFNASPKIETRSYEGWPSKPTGTNQDINTAGTIDGVDIPCLHVYTFGKPNYSFLRGRLIVFAKQASLRGFTPLKKLKVLPIFSAELEFSFAWFKTNHPTIAMDDILTKFNADNFPFKDCLDLSKGFIMFKESDISKARP